MITVPHARNWLIFLTILLALQTILVAPADAGAPALEVIVSRGDTLNDLCAAYLSDPEQCGEIDRFNQIRDPDRIEPGQRLLFPYALLKVRPEQPVTGSIAFASGDVSLREFPSGPWRPITTGSAVRQGNGIRTARDGRARLTFEDGSSLRLEPGTEIEVRQLAKTETSQFRSFFLGVGRVFASVRKAVTSKFDIETTTAIAGSRGTDFSVAFPQDRIMRTAVEEGTVGVSAMGQEVLVREGEGTTVRPGAPPERPHRLLPAPAPRELQDRYSAFPFEIRFSSINGAFQYRASLARDRDGQDVVAEQVIAVGAPMRVVTLGTGTYYLRTRSIDADGLEGPASAASEIKISAEPQPPLTEPAPAQHRWQGYLVLIMAIAAALGF